MFDLQEVLRRASLPLEDVNVMLHSPVGELGRVLPELIRTRPEILEDYQSSHNGTAERALKRGRPYVACFLKTGMAQRRGESVLVFVGVFHNRGYSMISQGEYRARPVMVMLREGFGVDAEWDDAPSDTPRAIFDLSMTNILAEMQGRLAITARLTQSYVRLAENFRAPIYAIHETPTFDAPPPDWRDMILTAPRLSALPPKWEQALRHWRGVYLIVDERDGKRYVGSAFGKENILGRWRAHVEREDRGVTSALSRRATDKFRFSILELLAPSASKEEVEAVEAGWKRRLHTREFGLNEN